jgi:hypothetical protein
VSAASLHVVADASHDPRIIVAREKCAPSVNIGHAEKTSPLGQPV